MPDSSVKDIVPTENDLKEKNGNNVTSVEELAKMRARRTAVTNRIRGILQSAAEESTSAMTLRDSKEFIEMGISESALEAGGALSEEQKLKNVEEMQKYAEMFAVKARELGRRFISTIDDAHTEKLISKESALRWKERLKKHSGSWPETQAFLESFNEKYVQNWKALKKDLDKVAEITKAFKIDEKTVKELKPLAASNFENKDYNTKRNEVSMALAALKEYMINDEKTKKLRSSAEAELRSAATEKIISELKVGPWLDHIMSGKRTFSELINFKKDWRRNKLEYDQVTAKMKSLARLPQGFTELPEEKFLLLSYAQRVSYVQEAKWRLTHHLTQPEDTPIEDLKGKIRHALDINDWEEADIYLKQAWKIAQGNDINELHSMEWHLQNFRTDSNKEKESLDKMSEIQKAYAEINAALAMVPGPMKQLYKKALNQGISTAGVVFKMTGNVKWCADRGYLNEEIIEDSREKSDPETHNKMQAAGGGHGHGREDNRISGYGKDAIRDRGVGPQNLHMDAGGEDAVIQKANQNKDVYSFWYWTNLIVKGVSIEEYNFLCNAVHPILKKNARLLQKYSLVYSDTGPPVSVN